MVEVAGRLRSIPFGTGRTMPSPSNPRLRDEPKGRSVLSVEAFRRILGPAHSLCLKRSQPVHESLQGRPEVSLLPTPRRCLGIVADALGFTDVSSVFIPPLRTDATFIDRTRVQKLSAAGTTCLVRSFVSRPSDADAQAAARPSAGFDDPARGAPDHDHMYMTSLWVAPPAPCAKRCEVQPVLSG
jgi:hypothetical protein